MDLKIKYKIIFWLMIFLLVLNVSTISVIFLRLKKLERFHNLPNTELPNLPPPQFRHRPNPKFRGFGKINRFIMKELNLDANQMQQYQTIRRDFAVKQKTLADSMRFYREMFDSELTKTDPDFEIMKLASFKIGEFHTKLRLNIADYHKKILNILNQNQKKQLAQFFEQIQKNQKRKNKIQ